MHDSGVPLRTGKSYRMLSSTTHHVRIALRVYKTRTLELTAEVQGHVADQPLCAKSVHGSVIRRSTTCRYSMRSSILNVLLNRSSTNASNTAALLHEIFEGIFRQFNVNNNSMYPGSIYAGSNVYRTTCGNEVQYNA